MEERSELSKSTQETYAREIRRFLMLFGEEFDVNPELASPEDISRYLGQVAATRLATQSSLSVHVAAVKHWYRSLHGRPLVLGASPRRKEARGRHVEREALQSLFRHTRAHPCGKMIRLVCAGVRLNELTQIRVADLDSDRGVLTLRGPDGRARREAVVPAGLKYELLHETVGKTADDFLFAIRHGDGQWRAVSPRTVQHYLAAACSVLGIGRLTVQALRENLVLQLLEWGLEARRIAELIGVKNQRSIARLRTQVPDSSRAVIDRLIS